ncbi:membrane protein [Microbacterium neimengense]
MRASRPLTGALLALATVVAAGCATSTGSPASTDEIAERVGAVGISADLVFTTEVAGYTLAPQSVGVSNDDGMSATWIRDGSGALISLRTQRGDMAAETCAALPMWDDPETPVTCTEQDGIWHREHNGAHEDIVVRDGAWVLIVGSAGATTDEIDAAAKAVHVPSLTELDRIFSDTPRTPPTPVERGDLPENGDGAPIQPSGPGG